MKKIRLAIFISHPIHYLVGLAREIQKESSIESQIYFCSDFGVREGVDITFGKKVKWYDDDFLHGLSYSYLKNFSFRKDPGTFFSLINPSIFTELWRQRFDAIFIHGWNYFSHWLAIVAALAAGTPIIMRGENPLNQEFMKPQWKIFIKKIIYGKILFPRISFFLYIGEENKKFYEFYGVPQFKLFFAPYAVDNERFSSAHSGLVPQRESLRRKIGIEPNAVVILFLGKLIDKKRPMDLLRAYEILSARYAHTRLIFVAEGWLRGELEKYRDKNNITGVSITGFKHQEDVPNYYTAADIFVLPSGLGETWGLVVNEALCFGLPIVLSDAVGSAKDLVRSGQNGYIFPTGNIKELVKVLEILILDPQKRKAFGQQSQEIIKRYSFKNDVEGLKQALDQGSLN